MEKKLYILTFMLVVIWFMGFFVFHATATIHALLIFAIITFLLSLLCDKALMQD